MAGRGTIPKIEWGSGFANTITFAVTLDRSITYPLRRAGSVRREFTSGVRDAWSMGTSQILEGTVRRIPIADTGGITGWDGATSWRAALEWMQDDNIFKWYPDAGAGTVYTCYLLEPTEVPSQFLETGYQKRGLFIRMRTDDDSPFLGY